MLRHPPHRRDLASRLQKLRPYLGLSGLIWCAVKSLNIKNDVFVTLRADKSDRVLLADYIDGHDGRQFPLNSFAQGVSLELCIPQIYAVC